MLNKRILDNEQAFFTVLASDDLWKELKKYMFPNKKVSNFYNYRNGNAAIKQGYLTLLKENNNLVLPIDAIDIAAIYGRLNIIQYLSNNNLSKYTSNTMELAATWGHFEVVKWLHYNNCECSIVVMDCAAAFGYLPIVEFLHYNRFEGCTTYAIEAAAKEGHTEVVKFLYYNKHNLRLCANKALNDAASNGHLEVVKFLHDVRISKRFIYKLLHKVRYKNNFDIIEYINRKLNGLLDKVTSNDNFDIIGYINHNLIEFKDEQRAINLARKNGHSQVVTFLQNN